MVTSSSVGLADWVMTGVAHAYHVLVTRMFVMRGNRRSESSRIFGSLAMALVLPTAAVAVYNAWTAQGVWKVALPLLFAAHEPV